MNTASLSVQKARALARGLRTSRVSRRYATVERDHLREAHDLYLLAQSGVPRHI